MGYGLLKGALSGAAVGAILVVGVSILSQPRIDPAPPAPLPRVASDTAGATDTPPPPQEPAPPETALPAVPDQDAANQSPVSPGEPAAPPEPTPEAFTPPPPPESEPPAVPPSPAATDAIGSGADNAAPPAATTLSVAAPPAAPAPGPAGPAVAEAPPAASSPSVAAAVSEPEPAPAAPAPPPMETVLPAATDQSADPTAREAERPMLAILLLDTPEMPDLAERIGALPFPVTVAVDPAAPEAAATASRLARAGAELLSLDASGAGGALLQGSAGRVVTAGGAPQLLAEDGTPRALPVVGGEGDAVEGTLDRAMYRAVQSGRAAILAVPTPEFLRALSDWASRQPGIRLAPLSETLAP